MKIANRCLEVIVVLFIASIIYAFDQAISHQADVQYNDLTSLYAVYDQKYDKSVVNDILESPKLDSFLNKRSSLLESQVALLYKGYRSSNVSLGKRFANEIILTRRQYKRI